MLIDIHTHVFPDAIAPKAIANLTQGIINNYQSFHISFTAQAEGTVSSLIKSMEECGCDKSIICPVVTNAKSTQKTNEFAFQNASEKIIPFASLIPTQEDWQEVLEDIASRGFKGIKLHPEFQNLDVDDPKSVAVIKRAEELGLIVMLHAGKDPGYAPPEHCSPIRLARVLEKVNGNKIIAAHMGGWKDWEDVEKILCGSPVYFDTSCIVGFIESEVCKNLIRKHGVDKILFGSDFPWFTAGQTLEFIKSLNLTQEEMDKICYKNAVKLLGL